MATEHHVSDHFDNYAGTRDPAGPKGQPLDALEPVVHDCIRQFGPRDTLASLAALFVREAIECRQPSAMALVLDIDAELLRNAVCDDDIDDR